MNDPEFNFSSAVRLAITNSLTIILIAPFRLLDNFIGGDGGQREPRADSIPAESSDAAAPKQEILLQPSEALMQRLLLEIPAITAPANEPALQTQNVDST